MGGWRRGIHVEDISTSYRGVSYQIYNHLQDSMLVTIKDHVFETSETKRPKVSLPNGSAALVQVRIVRSFELDAQVDASLFCLPLEDGYNLRTNISQPEFLLI
jgi:hypothetical protein